MTDTLDKKYRLSEIITAIAESLDQELRVSLPGEIVEYDSSTRRAVVQPMLKNQIQGRENRFSPVSDVPVLWPSTSRGHITFPLSKGDPVLLVFADMGLDPWLFTGRESKPAQLRSHDLSDAIAIPGLFALGKGTAARDDSFEIAFDGAKIRINKGGRVAIGNPAGEVMDIALQLVQTLQTATVATMLGAQPLDAAAQGKLSTLKEMIVKLKGTL